MAIDYVIKGNWNYCESGQQYTATANLKKSNRILAIAKIIVPIEEMTDIASYYNSDVLKIEIEKSAKNQVKILADATPEH